MNENITRELLELVIRATGHLMALDLAYTNGNRAQVEREINALQEVLIEIRQTTIETADTKTTNERR